MKTNIRNPKNLVSIFSLTALLLAGCGALPTAPSAIMPTPPATATPETANLVRHAPEGEKEATQEVGASYTLTTGLAEGKMAFIGTGGDIDGMVNPTLRAEPGDVVEIILINGDSIQHNVVIEDLNQKSEDVLLKGEQTRLVFTAEKQGMLSYYCDVPGHRAAGMEGMLIVGEEIALEDLPNISRAGDDLPGPLNRTTPEHVRIDLETVEIQARLADGSSYPYWTFNGKIPGPFLRVLVGDTIEVHLKNAADSTMAHSVDFHAATGPGGGAVATQTLPGGETGFTFKALSPGLYVYHCATPSVAQHIANGMYGLILVEPVGGLAPVDREFYVMQGEMYTNEALGHRGAHSFSHAKMLNETPEYFFFNGSSGALLEENALQARVGETVRIFFGVGGPNFTSSFHVIGEIFDRVFELASLTSPPLTDVQSVLVPTGGAVVVELRLDVPGRYLLVDHSLSRLERGLAGHLEAVGPEDKSIFDAVAVPGSGH